MAKNAKRMGDSTLVEFLRKFYRETLSRTPPLCFRKQITYTLDGPFFWFFQFFVFSFFQTFGKKLSKRLRKNDVQTRYIVEIHKCYFSLMSKIMFIENWNIRQMCNFVLHWQNKKFRPIFFSCIFDCL